MKDERNVYILSNDLDKQIKRWNQDCPEISFIGHVCVCAGMQCMYVCVKYVCGV